MAASASARRDKQLVAPPDITVLALGGASWPRLGSDARWAELLRAQGIVVTPLRPANCGFIAPWSEVLRRFEGQPLKRIALSFAGRSVRGEAMITRDGLEGGAVYALSSPIREAIERDGQATIAIDLLPDVGAAKLAERLSGPRGKQSLSNFLRKATHLSPAALSLVREAAMLKGLSLPALNAQDLAGLIKAVPVRLTGVQPIATAISTAGGVSFRRARRALHAAAAARRLRRRRNARLGCADRRLSVAGQLRHRGRGRARRAGVAAEATDGGSAQNGLIGK